MHLESTDRSMIGYLCFHLPVLGFSAKPIPVYFRNVGGDADHQSRLRRAVAAASCGGLDRAA